MQASATTLLNGFVSGYAVCKFEDTRAGVCSLLNVSIWCDGDMASCCGEYIDSDGLLVGVCLRFECTSKNEALRVMYRLARQDKPDYGIGDAVRALSYQIDVYDYAVVPMAHDYTWNDYQEVW